MYTLMYSLLLHYYIMDFIILHNTAPYTVGGYDENVIVKGQLITILILTVMTVDNSSTYSTIAR